MQLYSFFRSGTSHRVRIALNLKGLSAQYMVVDLRTEAHQSADYKALNPQGLVPALVKDGKVVTLNIEGPGKFEVSDADTLLSQTRH
jgi:maleylpyruvate isomerase